MPSVRLLLPPGIAQRNQPTLPLARSSSQGRECGKTGISAPPPCFQEPRKAVVGGRVDLGEGPPGPGMRPCAAQDAIQMRSKSRVRRQNTLLGG